jgi:hypothetical protein
VMKGGGRRGAARRREMRLASLHVRGIHDEHSHQSFTEKEEE